ncbi:hypothetical protein [Acinetobacter terrestris]|uniref:PilC beta-propeller domain-containing protein n=1 Tax=Acinetobacter terrestris TaxID=2529843 RepID=A0AAW6URV8_9GAMM|nr:hypothetical protein [Acinetobacter terrestris]MDK1684487.1 hypothetical protein [Acinetobacter terrestris]
MKKYKQGLATSLSALSTAILCHTTVAYASDIEIYKAPTTGGAYLMLVLDESASMTQGGTYSQTPITNDFKVGNTDWCPSSLSKDKKAYFEESHNENLVKKDGSNYAYSYTGRYCIVDKSEVDKIRNAVDKATIEKSCMLIPLSKDSWVYKSNQVQNVGVSKARDIYKCSDRMTALKKSLSNLIGNRNYLADTTVIGMTVFPDPKVLHAPVALDDAGRISLLNVLEDFGAGSSTPIAQGYSYGSARLLQNMSNGNEVACAGYGVYFLTDGEPRNEVYTNKAGTGAVDNGNLNQYLSGTKLSNSTNCTSSWGCVETAAGLLFNKNNTKSTEIKTAIVGFGGEFSFKNSVGESVVFNSSYTAGEAADLFTGTYQKAAARAAVAGKGGWFSADSTDDIVKSVKTFVDSIKVSIPAITTGSSAIPQDALNTSVIQPYAYFPQFQPTPSEDYRTWTGNLKKYNVVGGVLKDKTNTALFSSAGVLNKTNEDLWTPNYAAGTTLTADQQSLKALGGLLSRLNLKKTGSNLNRKVFTNEGTTLTAIDETYIKASPKTRGYYLGLLGYNITVAQISALNSATDVDTLLTSSPELRKIGAVMHSTPVLLTQSGTVAENSDGSVNTVNRDDYLLFGTTQGVLHVVKAGKSNEISTVGNTAGEEVFAFVPQEMLSAQGKAFLDPPQTVDATNTNSNGMNNLYYGVDGAWTAHTEYVYNYTDEEFKVYDSSSKYGKQWVYGGLRMGGRSYYALDLTKIAESTSNQPKVKFRINPVAGSVDRYSDTGTAVTTPYSNLNKMGESWSKPTIANVQWKGKRRLVMFVGGGYDRGYETFNYDQDSVTQNTSTGRGSGIGAGVYMFDANTGELLWSTYDAVDEAATNASTTTPKTTHYIGNGDELKYSVVSQIKGVDRDGDGDVDHLYFGDLGGQVFRVDLDSKHTTSDTSANYAKQITRIYNGHVANGYSPRFYEMPAFTVYSSTSGLFAVISIGSGNRSTPLLGKVVNATATNSGFITLNETAETNALLSKDAIYNIYDTTVTQQKPETVALGVSPIQSNLFSLTDSNRMLNTGTNTGEVANRPANVKGWYYAFTSSATVGDRKAVEKVQGDLIAIDNDLYVSTFDAEAVGTTESCGAGIYGASRAHRFCMPYGQCANGDTVANNTLSLGKGLLGITMGPGTSGADRRIITPLGTLPSGNKITGTTYNAANKLIPQSWYEKN